MADKIQLRRDLAANWTAANTILAQGELGLELETCRIKIGDGTSPWNDLPYKFEDISAATQAALDLKSDIGHTHVEADITDLDKFTQAEINTQQAAQDSNINTNALDIINNTGNISTNASAIAQEVLDRAAADTTLQTNIDNHISDTGNPHSVTQTQVGLGNVDNTSDIDKPISTDTQAALDLKADQTDLIQEIADRTAADSTLQTNLDNHTSNTNNPHEVTFTQAVTQDPGTDITVAEAEELTDGSTTNLHKHLRYKQLSGRFEIDTDDEWASWSDNQFGPSLQDWDRDRGNGAIPTLDWQALGILFPAGATLKRIIVKFYGNNGDVDDLQFFARAHDVDLFARSPIDSDAEIGAVNITPTAVDFDSDLGPADGNDMQAVEISLNDYTFTNDGDFHFFARSAPGSTTANRQLRTTIFIEWEI